MMISAPTLTQAREALASAAEQRIVLLGHVKKQGRKIAELEREVQKLSSTLSQAQQELADARTEVEALRSQLPDQATREAFAALSEFLAAPAEQHPSLRIAA